MRSRASRRRLSDNDIRCSASDRRWFPARPAQHVHRRRNNGKGRIPSALASAHGRNGKRRVEIMQRRTRRRASTIRGAAPDVVIGQSTAARAGAHPSYGGCQAWIVGVAIISFFKCDGVAIFAVMRKVLICLNALRRKLADQHASAERTLPCKALVTPSAQRVAEWKKKTE